MITARKCLALIFISVLLFVSGCGENSETIDPTKTQLYIGNLDSGVGEEWLIEIKRLYEAQNEGVQIIIDSKKNEYYDNQLLNNMKSNRQDIYFLNDTTYNSYVTAGLLEDITPEVTEKIYDDNLNLVSGEGTKSIIDTISDGQLKDFFNVGTEELPQYYGLPYFSGLYGIIYDIDLFKQKGFYFAKGGGWTGTGVKAAGPDKTEGTSDDGLPATWEDFNRLMTRIVQLNCTPFTWTAQYTYTRIHTLEAIWASYEGAGNFNLNNTFSGTDSVLGEITPENGYLLQSQQGKKAAITAAYDIIRGNSGKNFSSKAFFGTQDHIAAQTEFIRSKTTNKPIAMLLEGAWWENECRAVFTDMAFDDENDGYGKRNFAYMPLPRFIGTEGVADQQSDKTTLYYFGGQSLVCISKNSNNIELVKDFLKFVQSGTGLSVFTEVSGVIRPYDYDCNIEKLTPYAKSVWDIWHSAGTDIATDLKSSPTSLKIRTSGVSWSWQSQIGANVFNEVFYAFYNNPSFTADDYFNGLQTYFGNGNWAQYKA